MTTGISSATGKRLYQIRLACGDGTRKAEPLEAFVARVRQITGVDYDASTISLLERMKQKWKLDDVRTLAAVDPLGRGEVWLSGLDDIDGNVKPGASATYRLQEVAKHDEPGPIEDLVPPETNVRSISKRVVGRGRKRPRK